MVMKKPQSTNRLQIHPRLLFITLFLILAFITILSYKILTSNSLGIKTFLLTLSPQEVTNSATLLKYAAIDIGEENTKLEVNQLLETNFIDDRVDHRYHSIYSSSKQRNRATRHAPRGRTPINLRVIDDKKKLLDFRRVLRDWLKNKRFEPNIMSELINHVKIPIEKHYHGHTKFSNSNSTRYSSCAVVGNSGILLNNEYGELIDTHEAIIRLNSATIYGYKKNVGSRTTISFINSNILHFCSNMQGCYCHSYGENVSTIAYICQPIHFIDYITCKNSSNKAPLLITDSRFDILCSRIVKYYSMKRFLEETGKSIQEWGVVHDEVMFHYSSGFQAVILSLGICDKVSLFGFGKSKLAKHHYHTNQREELHLHDYEAEYNFYRDLIERPDVIPFLVNGYNFKIPPVVLYH